MRKVLFTLCLAMLTVLLGAGTAFGYHNGNPDPHEKYGYDPGTGLETDFCLQCHDIHAATGDYALMWQNTVTNTCATCHGVYQNAPTGPRNPGYPGQESGPAADKSVFEVAFGDRYTHEGHRLGQGLSGDALYTYTSGPEGSSEVQPYTVDSPDFIPGSGYPGVDDYDYITRIDRWTNFTAGADMSAFLASGRTALGGLYCASCHSPHGSVRGSALPAGLTKAKLLSSRPNHRQTPLDTSGWVSWVTDGANFCLACHQQRVEPGTPDGVIPHNHPSQFCLQCHADNPAYTADFPHTGAQNLLMDHPDQLCVASCHAFGLP